MYLLRLHSDMFGLIFRILCLWSTWITMTTSQESNSDASFRAFSSRYWLWMQHQSPDFYSTYQGINFTSNDIEQFSPGAFLDKKNQCSSFLQELQQIDQHTLDESNKMQYDLLEYTFQTLIDGYEWVEYGPYNPIASNPQSMYSERVKEAMNTRTVAGVEKILHWYTLIPKQVTNFIDMMNISIARGTTEHAHSVKNALHQMDSDHSGIERGINNSAFSRPFTDGFLNEIPADQSTRDRLKKDGLALVADQIVPAFTKMRDFVRNRYSAHTRAAVGVGSLPHGQRYYRQLLRYYLSADMTPEAVHRLGRTEVARIGAEMQQEVTKQGFNGTVNEFMVWYLNQTSSFFNTHTELLEAYRTIVNETRQKLSQVLKKIPTLPLKVESVQYPYATPGYYMPGSLDGTRPATFFVNIYDIKASPKMDMVALTMHEAEPGHHTQLSYSLQFEDSPLYRRIYYWSYPMAPFMLPSFESYVEGWGLYAEYLAEDLGAYTENYSRLGKLKYEMWRATRLVVDTGMHYYGWSKAAAVNYMTEHTALTPLIIENEVNRYIARPGQACAYKIGELKMRELRVKAVQKMGSRFSMHEFHDEILKSGRVSLPILEQRINAWMDGSTSGSPCPTAPACTLLLLLAAWGSGKSKPF